MRSTSPLESLSAKTISANSTFPRSRKSDDSLKTKSLKRTRKTNCESPSKPSTNRLKPAKQTRNRVPLPQRERILQKLVTGKSIIEISTEEKRDRGTISKIAHGPEMEEFVQTMRERFYGLGRDAINAVQHALTVERDGRLGFQLLASLGVVPSPEERQLLAARQAAAGESEDERVKKIMADLTESVLERARYYGMRVPELEKELEKVGGKINYETGKIESLEEKTST